MSHGTAKHFKKTSHENISQKEILKTGTAPTSRQRWKAGWTLRQLALAHGM
jgi:hypothetical protein